MKPLITRTALIQILLVLIKKTIWVTLITYCVWTSLSLDDRIWNEITRCTGQYPHKNDQNVNIVEDSDNDSPDNNLFEEANIVLIKENLPKSENFVAFYALLIYWCIWY